LIVVEGTEEKREFVTVHKIKGKKEKERKRKRQKEKEKE